MITTSAMSVAPNRGRQRKVLPLNAFTATSAALAGPHIGNAVDRDDAIEADADAAEQSPRRLAAAGGAPVEDVVGQQNACDRLTEHAPIRATLKLDLHFGTRTGVNRVVLGWHSPCGHAASSRYGARLARSSANGAGSSGAVVWPSWASRISAETTDRPMPAPSCPVTWNRPDTRWSGPITGR